MYKETVMSREKFAKVTGLSPDCQYMYDAALPELEAQAKITWEARQKEVDEAEQRGIKKVVDWIMANKSFRSDFMTPGEFYFRITENDWQAFLKEVEKC